MTNSSLSGFLPPDHCNTTNPVSYHVLSLLMIGEFVFGLPLNVSVLYIFLFRPITTRTASGAARTRPTARLFMLFLNRGASIAFLTTLSIDRYFNVVRLGKRNCVRFLPDVAADLAAHLAPPPAAHHPHDGADLSGRTDDQPTIAL
ncbi:unnamed protein product [Lota lota]